MRKHSAPSKVRTPPPADEPASGSEPHDGLPPGPRLRAMVSVLTALAMATIDTAIANTALPTIAKDLGVDPGASVWIVTIYQLACVAALMPLASLGEIVGQRRIHISGLVLFTVASLLAACAWSLPSLVVARTLQGLGASALMAANVALIRSIYPANQLGSGIGLNAFVVGVSFAIGPTVASLILFLAPWPWLFAVNVPIGLVGLLLAWISLPETGRSDERFDRLAALLTAGLFSLFVLGLGEIAHAGPSLRVAAEWVGAAICGIILLRRQAGHAAPMIATDLLRRPLFALSAVASICAFSAQGLAFVSLPFLLQHGLGHSQVETGFLMTPWPVVVAAMAPFAGYLSDRYAPGLLGGIGLAALCIGMVLLATLPVSPSIIDIVWRMAVCGAGFGFFQAPNVRAFMTSAPPARSGSASGMASLVRLLGQTTGATLVAACFALAITDGPILALYLGSGFAAVASAVSFMRVSLQSDTVKTDTDAGCRGV